jgi:protein O-GlcNAc transferase
MFTSLKNKLFGGTAKSQLNKVRQDPAATQHQAAELIKQGQEAVARDEFDEAERLYRRAIAADDASADAHVNLGNVLNAKGHGPAAVESYERAISIDPKHASAHYNLGLALHHAGDNARVVQLFRTAVRLRETFPQAWVGLALALEAQGDFEGAIESYRKAVLLEPDLVGAHRNLGLLCLQRGQVNAAAESYRRALLINPGDPEEYLGLASVLQEQGDIDGAIETYRQALDVDPNHFGARGGLLFALNYHPDKSAEAIFAEYLEYDNRIGLPQRASWRTHDNDRNTARRLKVGYISPDFNYHPVRHFLEPLLANQDKAAVEVFAYAELTQEDAVTSRYRATVDHWIPSSSLSDDALAARIRDDKIDVLVDLAGHTTNSRLGAFTRKPAPVSMSWLGFGYTTGLSAIDYFLTDSAHAPEGSEDLFTEQPWRVATPVCAYRPAEGMGYVSSLPAQDRGFVTFGTLTRSVRINHRSVRVWSRILHRVPGARLVVDSKNYQDESMRSALLDKFSTHGIGPERLQIGFHSPPWDVLRGMDIGLDCFPHNSGTTLFESLYMGVPYVTLAGRPSVGRLGSSILIGAGHPEWIARSEDEYVDIAVALASDLPALASLRAGLRAQMQASAVMDEPGFARKVEAAYREMFCRWVASSAPVK